MRVCAKSPFPVKGRETGGRRWPTHLEAHLRGLPLGRRTGDVGGGLTRVQTGSRGARGKTRHP